MKDVWIIRLVALCGFLGVGLGAFGAHGLKATIEAHGGLAWWQTATQYHLVHSVAALVPAARLGKKWCASLSFILGALIFSGSLYIMALTGITKLGMITPIGGVFFLAGWLQIFFKASAASVESSKSDFSQINSSQH